MKRFYGLLVCAFVALAAWQAEAAPVNIVDYGGSSFTSGTASAGCTTGQVAVVLALTDLGTNATGLHDSTGGTYTVSPTIFNPSNGTYFYGVIAKRVVGSGNQITTSSTFTVDATGSGDVVIEAYCIADGTGLATANDANSNAGSPYTAPAPTASTSYQMAMVGGHGGTTIAISTGGGTWTLGATHIFGNANIAIAWRKSGGTASISWTGTIGTFDGVGVSEVTTAAGAAKPHTMTSLGAG
jgi:hypothetical protein